MGETLEAFELAYRGIGYEPCTSAAFEFHFEKIAIFAQPSGVPTHAARQLDNGRWTSKLGRSVDIEHSAPDAVSGADYGAPVLFMRRPRRLQRIVFAWIRRHILPGGRVHTTG